VITSPLTREGVQRGLEKGDDKIMQHIIREIVWRPLNSGRCWFNVNASCSQNFRKI